MSAWREEDGQLVRDLTFDDFAGAMAFVQQVADLAEEAGHHPDILVHGFRHVRLSLMTHSQGAITDADRSLAGRIDELR